MKVFKTISSILLIILLSACSFTPHIGHIDIAEDRAASMSTVEGDDYGVLLCAKGGTQYVPPYSWSTPRVSVGIEKNPKKALLGGLKLYKAVKVPTGQHNLVLNYRFSNYFANVKAKDFTINKGETYYINYLADGDRFIPWIETSNGNVVFGKRQKLPPES